MSHATTYITNMSPCDTLVMFYSFWWETHLCASKHLTISPSLRACLLVQTCSNHFYRIGDFNPRHTQWHFYWACSTTPDDWTHHCVNIRVTLGGRGDQPQPFHTWSGSLIANMLQEACPRDQITEAVVLAPGETVLWSCKEGLLYNKAEDVKLSLGAQLIGPGELCRLKWP